MSKFIHRVTIWKSEGLDMYGQPSWSAPVVVKARWEDVQTLYLNANGREERGNSRVYLEKDAAKIGDHIYLGVSQSVTPEPESQEVRSRRSISNLGGTRHEHRVIV